MTGNVSKARRDALLKKIKEIRAFIEEAAAGDESAARLLEFADEIEKEARHTEGASPKGRKHCAREGKGAWCLALRLKSAF